MKIRSLLLATIISLFSGLSIPAFADDIELFTGPTETGTGFANILFMLDHSSVMALAAGDSNSSRLQDLKKSLKDVLNDATGINIGLGRFTHLPDLPSESDFVNTPIFMAVTSIDGHIVTGGGQVQIEQLYVPVSSSYDDALESSSGAVNLDSPTLLVTESISTTNKSVTITVNSKNYLVSFLGRTGNMWNYRIEEPDGGVLNQWTLDFTDFFSNGGCSINFYDGESGAFYFNDSTNHNIGWRLHSDFTSGEFRLEIVPDTDHKVIEGAVSIDIQADVTDYNFTTGITVNNFTGAPQIIGPKCVGIDDTSIENKDYDPNISYDGKEISISPSWETDTDSSVTWKYVATLGTDTAALGSWQLGLDSACRSSDVITNITESGVIDDDTTITGIKWANPTVYNNFSFTLDREYPIGYIDTWANPIAPIASVENLTDVVSIGNFNLILEQVTEGNVTTWKYRIDKIDNSIKPSRFYLELGDSCEFSNSSPFLSGNNLDWSDSTGFNQNQRFEFQQNKLYPYGKIKTWVKPKNHETETLVDGTDQGFIIGPLDCRTDYDNEAYLKQGVPKIIGPICAGVAGTSSTGHTITFQSYNNKTWTYQVTGNALDTVSLTLQNECGSKIIPYSTDSSNIITWTTIPEDGLISFTLDRDYPAVAGNLAASLSTDTAINIVGPDCTKEMILPILNSGGEIITGDDVHLGLRFDNIAIPDNAYVRSAKIAFFSTDTADDNGAAFTIKLQNSRNPTVFSNSTTDISNRLTNTVTETQSWSPGAWELGVTYRTPELASMVRKVNWIEGGSLAFIISGQETGSLLHKIASFDKDPSLAPQLEIEYDFSDVGVTAKQHVNNLLNSRTGPKGEGASPIVDALYEGAVYFRGGVVTHGKDRYNQQKNFVSVEASHSNRNDHYYPKNCKGVMSMISACSGEQIRNNDSYSTPIASNCQTNYIVLLSGGQATSNQSVSLIQSLPNFGSCTHKIDGTTISRNTGSEECGIALADYLYKTDQSVQEVGTNNVIVHTIGFAVADTTFLDNLATAGGGNFYNVSNATELEAAFKDILAKAMRDNAGLSLPGISINRFNKRFHSDKAYYAVFKPSLNMRWEGNIKKYRLGQLSVDGVIQEDADIQLLDVNGQAATDNNGIKDATILDQIPVSTGTAQSFWSTIADGKNIKIGGAGEQLMLDLLDMTKTRQVYTVCGGNTVLISDAACTSSELGLVDDTERTEIVSWLLGEDIRNEYNEPSYVSDEGTPTDTTDDKKYRWAFGDSLHSNPQAFTYVPDDPITTADESITKLFVGTNDGMVRMINAKTGKEEWAFVPKAMINPSHSGKLHAYGMDSPPVLWINDPAKDGIQLGSYDFVKLYIGMRRGGRNLYGINVTGSSTLGTSPTQMWVIEGGTTGTLGDFTKLGQTWSSPIHAKVNPDYCTNSNNTDHCDVLIFGGGYDTVQDGAFGNGNIGNAIYMVNANTGKLEWWASSGGTTSGGNYLSLPEMNYPITAKLKLLDSTGSELIDRIYVGDLGGQVWRIDLDLRDISGNIIERGDRVAAISNDNITSDKRRFFNGIAHYEIPYAGDLLMIASGRITQPMSETSVNNNFYAFLDKGWQLVDPNNLSLGYELNTVTESNLQDVTDWTTASTFNVEVDKKGWYISLLATGEKGTGIPVIGYRDGTPIVFVTTFVPPQLNTISNTDCTFQEGTSELYALNVLTGGPGFDTSVDINGHDQFDDTKAGNEASDRSITLKAPGMSAGAQIATIDDGSKKGNRFVGSTNAGDENKVSVDPEGLAERLYWRQVDE